MPSLIHPEEESHAKARESMERARQLGQARWEASLVRQLAELRLHLQSESPSVLAQRCGGQAGSDGIRLDYWGSPVLVSWPELSLVDLATGKPGSLFDSMLFIYYLRTADGALLADRWVSFRELRGGTFYSQAFQGYSGDHLAKIFDSQPELFHRSAQALHGVRLSGLGEFAYAFQPLPRLRLAGLFWPGDDEFPSRGSVLFDAASLHYMVLDGLAILGARLVSKLEKLRGS